MLCNGHSDMFHNDYSDVLCNDHSDMCHNDYSDMCCVMAIVTSVIMTTVTCVV